MVSEVSRNALESKLLPAARETKNNDLALFPQRPSPQISQPKTNQPPASQFNLGPNQDGEEVGNSDPLPF